MIIGVGAYTITALSGNTQRGVAATQPSSQVSTPAWGAKDLRDVALQMSVMASDAQPTSIQYTGTTRQAAAELLYNSKVDSDEACYAVVLHGNFIDTKAFLPPGATPPAGTTICFIVRASDGAVTDFGINNLPYSNLNQLGSVAAIAPQP
jgi:hypothetical protein